MTAPARASADKIVPRERLGPALARLRGRGTVVFTNGCFDLLHVGHLRLLESAAREGDVLIVGLNRDASVRRLKGPGRPLLPFEERARLVAALEVVDAVVGFDADTPADLVAEIAPDVLVKGGDWTPGTVVGREVVEARGGRIVLVPVVPDRSTTALVRRILKGE